MGSTKKNKTYHVKRVKEMCAQRAHVRYNTVGVVGVKLV